ncbi:peptidase domain-containing ABC transporter [Hymenobacter rubripertinctus]|uniref:Peptidase domain-containing ABC transporter n=1 Tax=Hymenobacter rubripertinctus TaxID=2029981 RepID=A0A418QPJ9_9BACT|nr:peptidase domain-containing ABC transporter [Hymenobacter rubripertinctus]RIY07145.1 peptidase domain-containing ABC transporter [Hymenobacter rubripertinctus]
MSSFPFYKQHDSKDCGPTCLRMVAKYYGRSIRLQTLRDRSQLHREGVSLLGISEAAESLGFHTYGAKLDFQTLLTEAPLPCILHWEQNHFVVLYKIIAKESLISRAARWMGKASTRKEYVIYIADPARGLLTYQLWEFMAAWTGIQSGTQLEGIALLLEPENAFFEADEAQASSAIGFRQLYGYLLSHKYKRLLWQIVLGLLMSSFLQLILPFLTQAVVDIGINTNNLNFVYLILGAQLAVFAGRTSVDFIRSWIILHISTRVNLSILSDFLTKLMKLPLAFFDTKMMGDLMQRLSDQKRIEDFLTGKSLSTVFSLFNLLIFGVVLALYNIQVFLIFLLGSALYAGWVLIFLSRRKSLDIKRFHASSRNQSTLVQLLQGMQEIKLSNSEMQNRWDWERIQARLFKLNIKGLALSQYQQTGAIFINEGKNIFITFFAAKSVIDGHLTLGGMLAIQYIIGQLNSPVEQLISFMQATQDAKLSMERLNEIHTLDNEETISQQFTQLPADKGLALTDVSFRYPGSIEPVLSSVSLVIPSGQTLAIVGASGSGKTTLLKLLLKFYEPLAGDIRVGSIGLQNISHRNWRGDCGVVMQDGYIFSNTIAYNIAVGEENPDKERILYAATVANIQSYVDAQALGYNTLIGMEGNGMSQGQRQRILIARAVYKNPHFIFLDEATNSLDANNESVIMRNLEQFFQGRTVVVVAHRLSTVRNAHKIIVMDGGQIVEEGTHEELVALRNYYYTLIKNQLELGQ